MPKSRRALLVLPLLLLAPAGAQAATFTPTTFADGGPGSLRAAVIAANAAPGADTIQLSEGSYDLTLDGLDANAAAGDLDVTGGAGNGLTITGPSADTTFIDAFSINDRILDVLSATPLTVSGVTITGGTAFNADGGGVRALGPLTLTDVAVSENLAEQTGPTGRFGGGIFAQGTTLTLTRVTVDRNDASSGGGISSLTSTLVARDSTIYGNEASDAASAPGVTARGGGLDVRGGSATLTNLTVAENTISDFAPTPGGIGAGVHVQDAPTLTVRNTLVADNGFDGDLTSGAQCDGIIATTGRNLDTGSSCFSGPGALHPADAGLGIFADFGGQTRTVELAEGSPAIDAGDTALAAPADQRGVPRPAGAAADIGAFEFRAEQDLGLGAVAAPARVLAGQNATFTFQVISFGSNTSVNDAATFVAALPPGATLVSIAPSSGSCAGLTCNLGRVTDTATITLVARTAVVGPFTVSGTVSSPPLDPDPTDQGAAATVRVDPAPAPPPPPPVPPKVTPLPLPTGLSAKLKPSRDTRRPYRYTVTGTLSLPKGVAKSACTGGKVAFTITRGKKRLSTQTATLTKTCAYRVRLTLPRKGLARRGSVKATVRFLGTSKLRARSGRTLTLSYGRRR